MLVIVDVKPNDAEIPTDAYFAIEEIKDVSIIATSDIDAHRYWYHT